LDAVYGALIVIVFIVLAANLFIVFRRIRRSYPRKTGKAALNEQEAAELRDRQVKRRIERAQEDAERRVELRNKTLALYEQVRRNAAAAEQTQADNDGEIGT